MNKKSLNLFIQNINRTWIVKFIEKNHSNKDPYIEIDLCKKISTFSVRKAGGDGPEAVLPAVEVHTEGGEAGEELTAVTVTTTLPAVTACRVGACLLPLLSVRVHCGCD